MAAARASVSVPSSSPEPGRHVDGRSQKPVARRGPNSPDARPSAAFTPADSEASILPRQPSASARRRRERPERMTPRPVDLSDGVATKRTSPRDAWRSSNGLIGGPARMTEQASVRVPPAGHVGFAVAFLDEALRFRAEDLGARLVWTGEMGCVFLAQVTGAHVRMAVVSLAGQTVELLGYRDLACPGEPAKRTTRVSRIRRPWPTTSTRFSRGLPATAGGHKASRRRSGAVRVPARG